MPLTSDPQILSTSQDLLTTLRTAFNTPNSYRPAHAKGHLVKGTFTPTPIAASLSKAPHFNNNNNSSTTPVLVRFSNSTGLPQIPDTNPNSNPRGLAVRFILDADKHVHTDIITHSTPYFPARTGEGFLALLQAIGSGTIGEFLEKEENLAAKKFVTAPKPFPESFITENYFGVNAYKFVNENGVEKFVRYRVIPEVHSVLSEEELKEKEDDYLLDELEERLKGKHVLMKLVVQVAKEGGEDVTNDATVHWPEDRELVELGTIKLESIMEQDESLKEEQKIIFDPIPRVEGIEPSDDPLVDLRAALYLISGRIRRAADPPMA